MYTFYIEMSYQLINLYNRKQIVSRFIQTRIEIISTLFILLYRNEFSKVLINSFEINLISRINRQ